MSQPALLRAARAAVASRPYSHPTRRQVAEPRRLAARAAAQRMAALLGEPVGARAGFRTRADGTSGPRTAVLAVTTGVLLRRLQRVRRPALHGAQL